MEAAGRQEDQLAARTTRSSDWSHHAIAFLLVSAQQYVGQFLATFKEFPPSQKPGSFSIDDALQSLQDAPKATGD